MSERLNNKNLKERIDQYVNGQLSPKEVDELWSELIRKEEYLDYMKSMANLKTVVEKRQAAGKVEEESKNYIYYAGAAVIALLIAILSVITYSTQFASQSVSPIADVELEYYRSANGTLSVNEGDKVIRNAIALANSNKVQQAIKVLKEEIAQTDDSSLRARLNLTMGSLFYNQGQYNDAISHYSRIIEQKNKIDLDLLTLEKVYWYRGNAYFHNDQLSKARADIQQTYEFNGAYRRVAERYLKALSE